MSKIIVTSTPIGSGKSILNTLASSGINVLDGNSPHKPILLPEDIFSYKYLDGLLLDANSSINTDIDASIILKYTDILTRKLTHYRSDYLLTNIYLTIQLLKGLGTRYLNDPNNINTTDLDNIYKKVLSINLYYQYMGLPYNLPSKRTPQIKQMADVMRSILRSKYGK